MRENSKITKKQRHDLIIEIITKNSVETQAQLTEALIKSGFDVTQATVSRDIKELRLIKLQNEIGTPIGYHVYNWHKIPFNNDYPHFMPAKESFKKGLKELKKHDIRVMPYTNVLLWDTKDKGNEDFEFEHFIIKE